jgi:hypothetical protein
LHGGGQRQAGLRARLLFTQLGDATEHGARPLMPRVLGEQRAQAGLGALVGLALERGLGFAPQSLQAGTALDLAAQGHGAGVVRCDGLHALQKAGNFVVMTGLARLLGLGRQRADGAVALQHPRLAHGHVAGVVEHGLLQHRLGQLLFAPGLQVLRLPQRGGAAAAQQEQHQRRQHGGHERLP